MHLCVFRLRYGLQWSSYTFFRRDNQSQVLSIMRVSAIMRIILKTDPVTQTDSKRGIIKL